MLYKDITLVDCVRDAIQGIPTPLSTKKKIAYIDLLLDSGLFDCLDFGSFVSAKAVPQMADTATVAEHISKESDTKLSVVIANERGAEQALLYPNIDFLGYPFSISNTFQLRNTKQNILESFDLLQRIQEKAVQADRQVLVYLSMAFGNPYGDAWDPSLVLEWIYRIQELGISRFSLADTTGEATPEGLEIVLKQVFDQFPGLDPAIHLHSRPDTALPKIDAAYQAGIRRFEGAILGYGGCPFAQDALVGNIPSELLLRRFERSSIEQLQALLSAFRELIEEA